MAYSRIAIVSSAVEIMSLFIELFAGSAHMSQEFERMGWETFSVDIAQNKTNSIDLVADIFNISTQDLSMFPDPADHEKVVIWAGVPCTYYSIANTGKVHFMSGGHPISTEAHNANSLVCHTLEIIHSIKPTFWFIENPRGHLHQQPFMMAYPMSLVFYCQYGSDYAKPTMLWGKHPASFYPKNRCTHKTHNQVIGKTETMSKDDRNLYPSQLIKQIAKSCDNCDVASHPSLREWS